MLYYNCKVFGTLAEATAAGALMYCNEDTANGLRALMEADGVLDSYKFFVVQEAVFQP